MFKVDAHQLSVCEPSQPTLPPINTEQLPFHHERDCDLIPFRGESNCRFHLKFAVTKNQAVPTTCASEFSRHSSRRGRNGRPSRPNSTQVIFVYVFRIRVNENSGGSSADSEKKGLLGLVGVVHAWCWCKVRREVRCVEAAKVWSRERIWIPPVPRPRQGVRGCSHTEPSKSSYS